MFWYGAPLGGGWGWVAGFGSLVFWALLAVAIFALVRSLTHGGRGPFPPRPGYYPGRPPPYGPWPGPGQPASPEQILAERFARGEIEEDEFHQRLTVLRAEAPHHPGPPGPGY